MRMLWMLLLCACLALASCGGAGNEDAMAPEPTAAPAGEDTLELLPASPQREGNHETLVADARDLLTAAQEAYARLSAAAEENAQSKEVCALYAPRLTELASTDLNALPDESLRALLLELSDTLAALLRAG